MDSTGLSLGNVFLGIIHNGDTFSLLLSEQGSFLKFTFDRKISFTFETLHLDYVCFIIIKCELED